MANESAFGSLGGAGVGAGIGALLAASNPLLGAAIGLGAGGMLGGTVGGMFTKKQKRPDISGELARISAMFEAMREQGVKNVNREAAQGRSQAVNNMAGRGTYRSPVANATFNQLEGERVNAVANMNAHLMGQEAQMRSGLMRELLGLDAAAQDRSAQIDAQRGGALTGLSSSLLMAALMRRGAAGPNFGNPQQTILPASTNTMGMMF